MSWIRVGPDRFWQNTLCYNGQDKGFYNVLAIYLADMPDLADPDPEWSDPESRWSVFHHSIFLPPIFGHDIFGSGFGGSGAVPADPCWYWA